jgi:hypothetical protein
MKNLVTSGVLTRHDCLYKVNAEFKKNESIIDSEYYVLAYNPEQAMEMAKIMARGADSVIYLGVTLVDQGNVLADAISYFDSQASSELNSLTETSPAELT